MARRLKNFHGDIPSSRPMHALHFDGRNAAQVQVAVRATSMKAAADALDEKTPGGTTAYYVSQWMSETGNAECLAALDQHPPGTVIIKAMDPGDTVMGSTGWVVAPKPHRYGTDD